MAEEFNEYQPGICNIGRAEISKRKKEFVASLALTLFLTGIIFFINDSPWLWVTLFAISSFTVLMYLQVRNRFCVKYGWFKKYNFGKLGSTQKINDPAQVARDRKKVIVMGIQTLLIAILYIGIIYFLK